MQLTKWLRKDGTIPDLSSDINVIKYSILHVSAWVSRWQLHIAAMSQPIARVVCVMSGMCAWLVASGRIPHVPTQQVSEPI
jgi:hypothetical protein